jgi:hypothetical protein
MAASHVRTDLSSSDAATTVVPSAQTATDRTGWPAF